MHSAESFHCSVATPRLQTPNIDVIPVHYITQSAPVSRTRLQELRLATQSDPTLISLAKTIHEGWPQSKKDCPGQLQDLWSFRQEISEADRLLYKNQRLIIPYSERLETLKVLHLGHCAIDKMQLEHWRLCTGLELTRTYSDSTKVVRLASNIQSLKEDGGPQYTSAEFKDFTKHWQIEHRVSSPRNPQSNGMTQHCVQTMKASLIKTIEKGEDVDLELLTCKTTPLNHRLPLLAELLNSRKF